MPERPDSHLRAVGTDDDRETHDQTPDNATAGETPQEFRRGAPSMGLREREPFPTLDGSMCGPVMLVEVAANPWGRSVFARDVDERVAVGQIVGKSERAAAYHQAGNAVHAPSVRHVVAHAVTRSAGPAQPPLF